jgi:hypothetical protein
MILEDRDRHKNELISVVEYLASFWNPEGVKKIRENRESQEHHSFESDEGFEDMLKSGAYRDNKAINDIQKNTNLKSNDTGVNHRDKRMLGLPKNIKDIHSLIED